MSILSLDGTLVQEADLRNAFPENCALAGAINLPHAALLLYNCLLRQQHRGEDGAGIVTVDNNRFYQHKDVQRVDQLFTGFNFALLPGHMGIGHNRYSTEGSSDDKQNVQPLIFNTQYGTLAIAHNGTLANTRNIRARLGKRVAFQSGTDTELFAHLIAASSASTLEDAIMDATRQIPVAYSFLILTPDKMIALRDAYGIRPLSIAKLGDGHVVCSETYAFGFDPACTFERDVKPGEMIIFRADQIRYESRQYAKRGERSCVFESIYFATPRSRRNGIYHEDFRSALGERFFEEHSDELDGDFIVPILDSGKYAAHGLHVASGIPYREAFFRNHHYSGAQRSFIASRREDREHAIRMKLDLRPDLVQGQRIILVDDSIVRGTTIQILIQQLRDAGAAEITVAITSPQVKDICPYGIDHQRKNELIAADSDTEEVRRKICADKLFYLSVRGLQDVAGMYGIGICDGCFTHRYPVQPEP